MRWNWQKPDWPHFQWDAARIAAAEEQFLRGAGTVVGAGAVISCAATSGLKKIGKTANALRNGKRYIP